MSSINPQTTVRPIICTGYPVISFDDKIAWIDGKPVKLTDEIFYSGSEITIPSTASLQEIKLEEVIVDETTEDFPTETHESSSSSSSEGEKFHAHSPEITDDEVITDDDDEPAIIRPQPKAFPPPRVAVKGARKMAAVMPPIRAKSPPAPMFKAPPIPMFKVPAAPAPRVQPLQQLPHQKDINIDELSDLQKETMFWEAIGKFDWKNKSDGVVNINGQKLTSNDKKIIGASIFSYIGLIRSIADDIDCFASLPENRREITILHIMLLGRNWFENILNSPDLITFIILSGEVQDFTADQFNNAVK